VKNAISFTALSLLTCLLVSTPTSAQAPPRLTNGTIADAESVMAHIDYLQQQITESAKGISILFGQSCPPGESITGFSNAGTLLCSGYPPTVLDLDGDGRPNNATFNAEELASLFLSSRPVTVSGDNVIISGGGAVKNERLWEFTLPQGFNLQAHSALSMTVDIEMEKANGADSDFAVGITDETKIMVFVNNDASNNNSQIFDGSILVSGGVTSHDEQWGYHFVVPGTERNNYRVGFKLDRNSTVIDVIDLSLTYDNQQGVFPEQLLQRNETYKIAIHANEVQERYAIKSVSINFPSELVDQD
jgi:hypothetical protein